MRVKLAISATLLVLVLLVAWGLGPRMARDALAQHDGLSVVDGAAVRSSLTIFMRDLTAKEASTLDETSAMALQSFIDQASAALMTSLLGQAGREALARSCKPLRWDGFAVVRCDGRDLRNNEVTMTWRGQLTGWTLVAIEPVQP